MRLVILTSRFPWPLEKGDKLRIYHQLRYLSEHFDIRLISIVDKSPSQEAIDAIKPFCDSIELHTIPVWQRVVSAGYHWLNGMPAQIGYFYSPAVKRKIYQSIIDFQPDRIYCQLIRVSEYVKTLPFVKVLDYMDTFSSGMKRQAKVRKGLKRLFYAREAKLTANYERKVFGYFDETTIISDRDRLDLPLLSKDAVSVIANGIDTSFFQPDGRTPQYDVAFVGNLGYKPNEEAVLTLLDWYRKAKYKGAVSVLIAGARPTPAILAIDEPGWHIAGWMEDIRDAYLDAKLFVAPLTIGSGLQNKLLEAMSCAKPCLTSSLVNDSIGATDGQEMILIDSFQKFQDELNKILDDPIRQKRIGENGRNFVLNHYQWETFNAELTQLIKDAQTKATY